MLMQHSFVRDTVRKLKRSGGRSKELRTMVGGSISMIESYRAKQMRKYEKRLKREKKRMEEKRMKKEMEKKREGGGGRTFSVRYIMFDGRQGW